MGFKGLKTLDELRVEKQKKKKSAVPQKRDRTGERVLPKRFKDMTNEELFLTNERKWLENAATLLHVKKVQDMKDATTRLGKFFISEKKEVNSNNLDIVVEVKKFI